MDFQNTTALGIATPDTQIEFVSVMAGIRPYYYA
jgi:hypothetical protein